MKLSPLQLEGYFLTDLTFRANQDFDQKKEIKFLVDDLIVIPEFNRSKTRLAVGKLRSTLNSSRRPSRTRLIFSR
jgi:hypothetical protein